MIRPYMEQAGGNGGFKRDESRFRRAPAGEVVCGDPPNPRSPYRSRRDRHHIAVVGVWCMSAIRGGQLRISMHIRT